MLLCAWCYHYGMAELDTERTHHLGPRAFFLFLGTKLFWIVGLALLIVAYWWYVAKIVPLRHMPYFDYSVRLFAVLLGAYTAFVLMRSFLEYYSHRYRFDKEFFHLFRGYINQEEVSVVYHQIQTVTIQRPLAARFFGVAHIAIEMGNGEGGSAAHLRGLDVSKARHVQRELVARSKQSHEGGAHARQYRPVPFEDFDDEETG